ncbi:hypothetical protein [Brevundimonas sp.]|uniref:hypothetical protein n=1 Tax=Brevundimonas sp. TaxID=1871086 RepID=UPI001DF2E2A8|nr:hypothetical protein [Brevundimonas sp.]MBA4001374.1 hypothetical protein [Brevundimonas sp.]
MRPLLLSAALAGLTLAACSSGTKAPFDQGVCYHVVREGEEVRFNVLAEDVESIEFCAARLEEMRLNFLRLGGSVLEIQGAYQGQFIFIERAGVYFGQTLEGGRFFALARTGDGRLAIPGVIQRPPARTETAD